MLRSKIDEQIHWLRWYQTIPFKPELL
ncbi:hypothetical protein CHELA40_13755 [Chelatococcus asaccharovorans]|nr:hypothetical protein CHELA40_13755 [Chelatococcus asaccharovorans]CAH1675849.1 hypothetical protein CHELA17_61870 [Chelatococcus asaccharovorans]